MAEYNVQLCNLLQSVINAVN